MAAEIKKIGTYITVAQYRNNLKTAIKNASATLNQCIKDFIDLCNKKDPNDFTADDVQKIINRIPDEKAFPEKNDLSGLDKVDKITYSELLGLRRRIKRGLEHIVQTINLEEVWCFWVNEPFITSLMCQKDLMNITEGKLVRSDDETFRSDPLPTDSPLRKITVPNSQRIVELTIKIAEEIDAKMQELENLFRHPENIAPRDLQKIINEFPIHRRIKKIKEMLKKWPNAIPFKVAEWLDIACEIPMYTRRFILEPIERRESWGLSIYDRSFIFRGCLRTKPFIKDIAQGNFETTPEVGGALPPLPADHVLHNVFDKIIHPHPNTSAISSLSQPVEERKAMSATSGTITLSALESHTLPNTAVSHAPISASGSPSNLEQARLPLAAILGSSMAGVTGSSVAAPAAAPAASNISATTLKR